MDSLQNEQNTEDGLIANMRENGSRVEQVSEYVKIW